MNELSLFSGAGGGLLGTKWLLGWRTIGYVEIEPFCQEILKARIADGYLDAAPIFGDIRAFIADGYADAYQGMVDVVTGGFPCQDISCAGNRAGIEGERSGLWKQMAEAIRIIRPRFIFVENSPMLTVRGLGVILRDMAEMGFNARWGVFSYAEFGGGIIRERVFVAGSHKKFGGFVPRWATEDRRNMGEHRKAGSPIDWFMEGVVRSGKQCTPGTENSLPPYLCRVSDGVVHELDRLKAIGNGQVPRVVKRAWEVLT